MSEVVGSRSLGRSIGDERDDGWGLGALVASASDPERAVEHRTRLYG